MVQESEFIYDEHSKGDDLTPRHCRCSSDLVLVDCDGTAPTRTDMTGQVGCTVLPITPDDFLFFTSVVAASISSEPCKSGSSSTRHFLTNLQVYFLTLLL